LKIRTGEKKKGRKVFKSYGSPTKKKTVAVFALFTETQS